jgi:hypothetical protein
MTVPSPSIWNPLPSKKTRAATSASRTPQQEQKRVDDDDKHSEEQQSQEEDATEQREAPIEVQLQTHPLQIAKSDDLQTSSLSLHEQSSPRQYQDDSRHLRRHSVHHTRSGACLYETSPVPSESKKPSAHPRRYSETPSFYEEPASNHTPTASDGKAKDTALSKTPTTGRKLHLRRKSRQLMNKLGVVRSPSAASTKDLSTTETVTEDTTEGEGDTGFIYGTGERKFLEHYILTRQVSKPRTTTMLLLSLLLSTLVAHTVFYISSVSYSNAATLTFGSVLTEIPECDIVSRSLIELVIRIRKIWPFSPSWICSVLSLKRARAMLVWCNWRKC